VKILVTGRAGYIGSILAPALLQKRYDMTVIDSCLFNQVSLFKCFANPNFGFVGGDT